MGIKFLNLQRMPIWCFHMMGNQFQDCEFDESRPPPAPSPRPTRKTIKLIKSDGVVKVFRKPVKVSDLLLEFPKHLVCASDSFYIGQKIPALSSSDELQLGCKYFLLPTRCFQSVLSFVSIASFATSAPQSKQMLDSSLTLSSRSAFLKKIAASQPFDIQKSPSGCKRIRVSDDFIWQLIVDGRVNKETNTISIHDGFKGPTEASSARGVCKTNGRVCTTEQLQKDYSQLVGLRQWKPKLETIKENKVVKEKKKRKLRRLSAFILKRKKKSNTNNNTTSVPHKSSDRTKRRRLTWPRPIMCKNEAYKTKTGNQRLHNSTSNKKNIIAIAKAKNIKIKARK